MVATPGDPRNSVALSSLGAESASTSLTGFVHGWQVRGHGHVCGSLRSALDRGEKIHRRFDSIFIRVRRRFGATRWSADISRCLRGGATLLEPRAERALEAGPASHDFHEVTVSAQMETYPGEAAPGQGVSREPWLFAASAMAGRSLRSSGSDWG